jgi:hypothetical protein
MNPNKEIEGHEPGSENQTVNEGIVPDRKPVTVKLRKVPDSMNPMKPGIQFKFSGIIFEVIDNRKRGRAFVRMLGIPAYFDENGKEV